MDPEIEIRELPAQPVMCVQRTFTEAEIPAAMSELLPMVYGYVMAAGPENAGMPYSRYYAMSPQVQMEVGVMVTKALPGSGDIKPGELPAGKAAVAVHLGPYEKLHTTYQALMGWVAEQGYDHTGAPWEVYLTDPQQEPDSAKWRTDIFMPVRATR